MINVQRLINTFLDMVRISSESGAEDEFATYVISLGTQLGARSWQDAHGNVYLHLQSSGDPVMLNTHMDTVTPGQHVRPQVNNTYITSDGTTILGADSKAGIAAMIELLYVFQNSSHPHLVFTFTRNEETGIPTAPYLQPLAKTCLVPDRGTPLGEIIIQAPHAQVFETRITGKSAYATTNYDDGHHAIMAAAHLISQLPCGNFRPDSTSNIGIINGGTMTTSVPEICTFKGNCYSFDKTSLDYFFNQLQTKSQAVDQQFNTQTHTEFLESFPGFSLPSQAPLVTKTTNALRKAGLIPKFKKYRAVSNANHLNALGMQTVLISTGVEHQHTTEERIAITSLTQLTEILYHFTTS